MTDKMMYWGSVMLSGLALLLFVMDTSLVRGNRDLQVDIAQRQGIIDAAARLSPLNQNLAQALAEVSVRTDDEAIRDMLAAQGIRIQHPQKAAAAEEKTPAPAKKRAAAAKPAPKDMPAAPKELD